jgi:protein gp37
MAEQSAIAWTHSTFNPWIGCTKVGPGCENCYAETLDRNRYSKTLGGGTKQFPIAHWGPGAPRHRTKTWGDPLVWNRKAAASGQPWRVFCASLADVFDNEVDEEWRADLFRLIGQTPNLTWLLLTKRIGNAAKMLPWTDTPWANVWIGATIVNQEEWDRDREKLLSLPAAVRFVSYEPAIGPIRWGRPMPDWIIVGGESGAHARAFRAEWARDTVRQCRAAKVAPFVKQMGARVLDRNDAGFDGCEPWAWPLNADGSDREIDDCPHGYVEQAQGADCRVILKDRAGADPAEWPVDLRVQEFPA